MNKIQRLIAENKIKRANEWQAKCELSAEIETVVGVSVVEWMEGRVGKIPVGKFSLCLTHESDASYFIVNDGITGREISPTSPCIEDFFKQLGDYLKS